MNNYKKSNFWGITTYYNSENYKTKYTNFAKFRDNSKKQGLNLLVVECAFKDQSFVLTEKDAEILIQVRSNSVLWQKERLLNIGLENLPESCTKFAWLDCDILFLNEDWVAETSRLLDTYKVVQPYEFAIRLDKNNNCKNIHNLPKGKGENVKYDGVAARNAKNIVDEFHGHTGFAWSARRKLFDKIGFYDRFILGNGDTPISESFFNENTLYNHSDTPITKNRVDWTKLIYSRVKGDVYYTEGTVLHLWHGDFKDRRHKHRRNILKEFNFDEDKDMVLNKDGCWEWNTQKIKLIEAVNDYFRMRLEDGRLFDWKDYLSSRPNLQKRWNGPVRSFLHFFVFKRIDDMIGILKKKCKNYIHIKSLKKEIVPYNYSSEKSFDAFSRSLKLPAKIFSFQKNEELLEYWISHHAKIFGMKNLYIIDHDSNVKTKNIYDKYTPLGLNVYVFKGDFTDKHYCLSIIMSNNRRGADFLIPIDGDEFIYLDDEGKITKDPKEILNYLRSPYAVNGKFKMLSYENVLETLEPKDVVAECKYFKKDVWPFHREKTYYHSKYFVNTDQGNHFGLVSKYNDILVSSKLMLLHYSRKSYTKYIEKLKRGVRAYHKYSGLGGRGWFNYYSLYEEGKLKEEFIRDYVITDINNLPDDVIFVDIHNIK